MSKVIVKASRDGFRRAGFTFTRAGVELDLDELSKEQKAAIEGEPMLTISQAEAKAEAEAEAKAEAEAEDDGKKQAPKKPADSK